MAFWAVRIILLELKCQTKPGSNTKKWHIYITAKTSFPSSWLIPTEVLPVPCPTLILFSTSKLLPHLHFSALYCALPTRPSPYLPFTAPNVPPVCPTTTPEKLYYKIFFDINGCNGNINPDTVAHKQARLNSVLNKEQDIHWDFFIT